MIFRVGGGLTKSLEASMDLNNEVHLYTPTLQLAIETSKKAVELALNFITNGS